MEKLKYISVFVFLLFIGFAVTNDISSQMESNLMPDGTSTQIVEKPLTMSTEEYIKILNKVPTRAVIQNSQLEHGQTTNIYFINKDPEIENITINGTFDECISDIRTEQGYVDTLDGNILICPLGKLVDYSVDLQKVGVNFVGGYTDEIDRYLKDNQLRVERQNSSMFNIPLFSQILVPLVLFFLAFVVVNIFIVMNSSRRYGIYKLNGVKLTTVLKEEVIRMLVIDTIILGLVTFIIFIYLLIQGHPGLIGYIFQRTMSYAFLFFVLLQIITIIYTILIYKLIKINDVIKNKVNYKVISFSLKVMKVIFLGIVIANSFALIKNVANINKMLVTASKYESVAGYYTTYVNGKNLGDTSSEEWNDKEKKFYLKYNDQFNGILADASNYYDERYIEKNVPEHSFLPNNSMVVNKNYLVHENIQLNNPDDQRILDGFSNDSDKGLIMIPEKYRRETGEIKTNYQEMISDVKDEDVEIIYYENKDFFTYNSKNMLLNGQQEIEDPIVYLINPEKTYRSTFSVAMGNYDAAYFVKPENKEQLLDALEDTGLDEGVQEVFLKQSENSEAIQKIDQEIKSSVLLLVLTLGTFIFLNYYYLTLLLKRDQRSNSIEFLNGYKAYDIYSKYFIDTFIVFGVCFAVANVFIRNPYFTLTVFLVIILEIALKILIIWIKKKNYVNSIKGEE